MDILSEKTKTKIKIVKEFLISSNVDFLSNQAQYKNIKKVNKEFFKSDLK